MPDSIKFWGLLIHKERWGLSRRGVLVAGVPAIATGFLLFLGIHPFLAVTHRVDASFLVVEGWVPQFTIEAAVKEFDAGHYKRAFVTGGPLEGNGGYSNEYNTEASVGAGRLKAAGIPGGLVQMVPSQVWNRNRTYYSAVALREWYREHNMSMHNINVLTEDAHARRTWLLFQEAFGKDVKVGIISIPSPDYDAKRWWRYSEGAREVIDEGIAYIYAKLFFWPEK